MKKFFSEFKEFALKGNMFDLAVGLIIGTAFNAVVKSIVDNLFMPLVGILTGGQDFSTLTFQIVGDASIPYGAFIQSVINFIVTALSLFVIVKCINKFKKKEEVEAVEQVVEEKAADIVLLEEIRDALKELKKD